jgi:hypothetical protein
VQSSEDTGRNQTFALWLPSRSFCSLRVPAPAAEAQIERRVRRVEVNLDVRNLPTKINGTPPT